jgi:hypothetical protein
MVEHAKIIIEEGHKGFGTVASRDVPTTGDATFNQVVLGSDSRLHKVIIVDEDEAPNVGDPLENGVLVVVLPSEKSYLTNFSLDIENKEDLEEFDIILGG